MCLMEKYQIVALMCCLFMIGCKDDFKDPAVWDSEPCDPSKPVEFIDFTPKEGGVRTRMYITGSNFGTDENKIHVMVGGREASVIGSDGSKIYCMVPSRAYDGDINVVIDDKDGNTVVDYTFEERFSYQSQSVVGTLLRNYNSQTGAAPFQDGAFDEGAGIPYSDWMMFDPKADEGDKVIFTSNYQGGNAGIRTINLTKEEVKTVYAGSRSHLMLSFTFSSDGDTLLIADDNARGTIGDVSMPNIHYLLRSENFQKLHEYSYGACAYSLVYMPDGTIFYTVYPLASIVKMVKDGGIPVRNGKDIVQFALAGQQGRQIKMKLHPSGKFVYLFSSYDGLVRKSEYDPQSKTLKNPTIVAGTQNRVTTENVKEGAGALARFATPWCGEFVKNSLYEREGRDDVYDFYMTDADGHCIWKITPDGIASIAAGRSNYTEDNSYVGYIDGDPLKQARFHNPRGICYDEAEETFYIGDVDNHCIRYLRHE